MSSECLLCDCIEIWANSCTAAHNTICRHRLSAVTWCSRHTLARLLNFASITLLPPLWSLHLSYLESAIYFSLVHPLSSISPPGSSDEGSCSTNNLSVVYNIRNPQKLGITVHYTPGRRSKRKFWVKIAEYWSDKHRKRLRIAEISNSEF